VLCCLEAIEKKQAERAEQQNVACDVEHDGNEVIESAQESDTAAAAVNNEDSSSEVNTAQNLVSCEALYPVCYPD